MSSTSPGLRRTGIILAIVAALIFSVLSIEPAAAASRSTGGTTPPATTTSALIVYDDNTGVIGEETFGWISEAYATQVANLAGRFGATKAIRMSEYTNDLVEAHTAIIYVGALYRKTLPEVFVTDMANTSRPIVWLFNNIWTLGTMDYDGGPFVSANGWRTGAYSTDSITGVTYKSRVLGRHPDAGATLDIEVTDPAKVQVLASTVTTSGVSRPWAIRDGNLTYVGDMPLSFTSENDRYLVFSDLLYDALAPTAPERHRALVRLEDVGPDGDPVNFRALATYLGDAGVPFSFGVYPRFENPLGADNGGVPQTIRLRDRPEMVSAIKYAISRGGTPIMHGWTHQYASKLNPYNGRSGDDFEFYLAHEQPDAVDPNLIRVIYDGPVAEDSTSWALNRVDKSAADFKGAGLATPKIFEFPHYAGSATDYKAIATRFTTRYERSLYPEGVLRGGTPNYAHVVGQFFPYVVKDVYGTKVLPENLGNYEPEAYNTHPIRLPSQIIDTAKLNLVVRDGFASFFYHPFLPVAQLKETVEGIQAAGYTFVSPTTL